MCGNRHFGVLHLRSLNRRTPSRDFSSLPPPALRTFLSYPSNRSIATVGTRMVRSPVMTTGIRPSRAARYAAHRPKPRARPAVGTDRLGVVAGSPGRTLKQICARKRHLLQNAVHECRKIRSTPLLIFRARWPCVRDMRRMVACDICELINECSVGLFRRDQATHD